jgi:hypothetical protein
MHASLILSSDLFSKAPRMSRLLRFLVNKAISGDILDTPHKADEELGRFLPLQTISTS